MPFVSSHAVLSLGSKFHHPNHLSSEMRMTGIMSQLFRPGHLDHLPREDICYPAELRCVNDKGGTAPLPIYLKCLSRSYQKSGKLGSTSVLIGKVDLTSGHLHPKYWTIGGIHPLVV